MTDVPGKPGISRDSRISHAGLLRLEKQLQRGQISDTVLTQWIRRYGDAAREIIERHRRILDAEQDPD